jgi:C-terminal processing protease CtpA/Prc
VNRLIPGSPADMAGLRAGDRIYRISGNDFATGDEFRELARTLHDPLTLEVETSGQVRSVEIPRLEPAQEKTPAGDASAPPTGES